MSGGHSASLTAAVSARAIGRRSETHGPGADCQRGGDRPHDERRAARGGTGCARGRRATRGERDRTGDRRRLHRHGDRDLPSRHEGGGRRFRCALLHRRHRTRLRVGQGQPTRLARLGPALRRGRSQHPDLDHLRLLPGPSAGDQDQHGDGADYRRAADRPDRLRELSARRDRHGRRFSHATAADRTDGDRSVLRFAALRGLRLGRTGGHRPGGPQHDHQRGLLLTPSPTACRSASSSSPRPVASETGGRCQACTRAEGRRWGCRPRRTAASTAAAGRTTRPARGTRSRSAAWRRRCRASRRCPARRARRWSASAAGSPPRGPRRAPTGAARAR
jgi:hypothetical protein